MMKKISHMGIIVPALAAALMVMITPAYAIDFTISGQLNRAMMYVNDGDQDELFFVDNENSSTRFRFRGSNEFENGWTVGFLWEVEMQSNSSDEVKVAIYDISGRKLHGESLKPGNHQKWHWEGWPELPSGIYFIELGGADTKEVKKATLIR